MTARFSLAGARVRDAGPAAAGRLPAGEAR